MEKADYVSAGIAAFAVLVSIVTALLTGRRAKRQINVGEQHFLTQLWSGVLDLAFKNPKFLDPNITENYLSEMSDHERIQYDIYCHKAWGQVLEVVERKYASKPKFQVVIQWLVTFHYKWLQDNPAFFISKSFWKAVDRGKSMPAVILRHRQLPQTRSGEVDWDKAAADYHSWLLSPLNPMMVTPDRNGVVRNTLVTELRNRIDYALIGAPDGTLVEIADFGCGPGNLLESLADKQVRVIGADKSVPSLHIANRRARRLGIEFEPLKIDLTDDPDVSPKRFETIVAVNSILPEERTDVHKMLLTIRKRLVPGDGRLLAIMPSFDTTEHLHRLWFEQYRDMSGSSEEHAARVTEALRQRKRMDPINHRYADDGHNVQCYHTKETLEKEFREAGMKIVRSEKIYYPWELTRRFDYGYFPNHEEIWDWFVEAKVLGPVPSGDRLDGGASTNGRAPTTV